MSAWASESLEPILCENVPFSLVSLKVFFPVYVGASLAYLPPPHLIPLENNAFRQLFCHKILNINTSQRQHPQRKPGVECKVRMENFPERKAQTREILLLLCYKPTPLTHKQWDVHLALFFGVHVCSPSHLRVHNGYFFKENLFWNNFRFAETL